MKIFPKLFIGFSASFLVVIALLVGFLQWNFKTEFLNYIQASEINQLSQFAGDLEDYYAEVQTWEFIRSNPRIANVLLNEKRWIENNIIMTSGNTSRGREFTRYRFTFGQPKKNKNLLRGRLSLYDAKDQLLIGFKTKEVNQRAIRTVPIYFESNQVGTLALLAPPGLIERIDMQFAEAQQSTLYGAAFIALIFAGLISLLFTMNFTGPIRRLALATKELIGGEFKTRVKIKNKDEMGRLSRDFNILAKTLDKNSESQKQWIADIYHELRTPLAILKSEIESIHDGIRNFDAESLISLSNEVERLNSLVEDLYELALSDIGAMKYKMADINLSDLLSQTLTGYTDRCVQNKIQLNTSIDDSFEIIGDEKRLGQLFTNLLENSLRYTDAPGTIEVATFEESSNVVVTFSDSAPSVDQESMDKIFERLFRKDSSRSRENGGAGIGLSICKAIVEAHSGTINAQSSALGGLFIEIKFNKK